MAFARDSGHSAGRDRGDVGLGRLGTTGKTPRSGRWGYDAGMKHRRRFDCARAPLAGLALLSVLAASGCYRRVVRAEGPGTQDVTTYEPNLKDNEEPIDLFGTD